MSNNNRSSSSSSDYSNLMNAATIVCIRRNVRHVSGGFEVLLGQNECKNWLRSTPQRGESVCWSEGGYTSCCCGLSIVKTRT